MENDLERVWKEFGKHSEAGKLLYELYGVRYRPDKYVNYPKLKLKIKEEKEKQIKVSAFKEAAKKIDYSLPHKPVYSQFSKLDFIPKRKKETAIKKELESIKSSMKPIQSGIVVNRKKQIERLQDNFQFQERTVMPKGARLPGLKNVNVQDEETERKPIRRLSKREELDVLYNNIMKEIDERYEHLNDMKCLGKKNMDVILMGEIKERIEDLKRIQKMIDECDQ